MNIIEDVYIVLVGHSAVVTGGLESGAGVLDGGQLSAAECFIREQENMLEIFINNEQILSIQLRVLAVLENKLTALVNWERMAKLPGRIKLPKVTADCGRRVWQSAIHGDLDHLQRQGQQDKKRSRLTETWTMVQEKLALATGKSNLFKPSQADSPTVALTATDLSRLIYRLEQVIHVTRSRLETYQYLVKFRLDA